jgi:hypothetical protein
MDDKSKMKVGPLEVGNKEFKSNGQRSGVLLGTKVASMRDM